MDRYEACIRSQALYEDLCRIVDGDPGQEVYGIAVPVIDELLTACKQFVPDDPVVKSIEGLMRPESLAANALRAVDAMLVVNQLTHALRSGMGLYWMTGITEGGGSRSTGLPSRDGRPICPIWMGQKGGHRSGRDNRGTWSRRSVLRTA